MKKLIRVSIIGLFLSSFFLKANIPEPDILFYGKVSTQLGMSEVIVTEGTLNWEILSRDDEKKQYSFSTELESLSNGQYSYQLKIPQEFLTELETLEDKEVEVMTLEAKKELFLRHYDIRINGEEALITNEKLHFFSVNEESRAKVQRLDLSVPNSVLGEKLDVNKNGIPDAWEELYGLSGDDINVSADIDGDGWTTLEEYERGTNPTKSNKLPSLLSDLGTTDKGEFKATVFENGLTQLRVQVVDSDTELENINVVIKKIPNGIKLFKSDDLESPLAVGSMVVASSLNTSEVLMTYSPIIDVNGFSVLENLVLGLVDSADLNGTEQLKEVKLDPITVDSISEPLRWFDGKTYGSQILTSLKGRSGESDDILGFYVYSSTSKKFIASKKVINVDAEGFVDSSTYVNVNKTKSELLAFSTPEDADDALALSTLGTVYIVYKEDSQELLTLFHDKTLRLGVENSYVNYALSNSNEYFQSTLRSNIEATVLGLHQNTEGRYLEYNGQSAGGSLAHLGTVLTDSSILSGFGYASGRYGKLDGYTEPFNGMIGEFVAFDDSLEGMNKWLMNAYLLSKWNNKVVSDASHAVAPVSLQANNQASILLGGLSDDTLRGTEFDDILVGGLGKDSLYGGLGKDQFILGDGDTVEDFSFNYASSQKEDVLDLRELLNKGEEDLKHCLFFEVNDDNTLVKVNKACKGEDLTSGSDFNNSNFRIVGQTLQNADVALLWHSGSIQTGSHKPSSILASISLDSKQSLTLNENKQSGENQSFNIKINYEGAIVYEGDSLVLPLEVTGTATPYVDFNLSMSRYISTDDNETIYKVTAGTYTNFEELLGADTSVLENFNLVVNVTGDVAKMLRQDNYDLLQNVNMGDKIYLPAQVHQETDKSIHLKLTLFHDEVKEVNENLSIKLLEVPEYYRVNSTKNSIELTLTDGLDKISLEDIKEVLYEGNTQYFKVNRVGSIDNNLTVNIELTGTSKNGVDYENVLNQVVFEAGERSLDIAIATFEDGVNESTEVIELVLVNGINYEIENRKNKAFYYLKDSSEHAIDEDEDGLLDSWEVEVGLNPLVSNLNEDGLYMDSDSDGLDDKEEYLIGSNPSNSDSDGDGLTDDIDMNPLVAQNMGETVLGNQIIKVLEGNSVVVPAGMESIVRIPMIYSTSTNDDGLEGLGLKLQYNQNQLEFLSFAKVLKRSHESTNGTPIENDVYRGSFKLYSHEIGISWASESINWPMMPLPTQLVVARFKVKDAISVNEESIIQISSSKTSTGYGLKPLQFTIKAETIDGLSAIDLGNDSTDEDRTEFLVRILLGVDASKVGATEKQTKVANAYMEKSSTLYDIDGDGEVNPLVDTVLLYRYIKGTLKAEDLTSLLNENSIRRTLDEIEDAIQRILADG